jgi:hypothetical protein
MKINVKDITTIELTLNCAQQHALILEGRKHQALQRDSWLGSSGTGITAATHGLECLKL